MASDASAVEAPDFLAPIAQPDNVPVEGAEAPPPPAQARSNTVQGFSMQRQSQDQWCWSAVGVSIALKYDPQLGLTQCALATRLYAKQGSNLDCCGNDQANCNKPQALADVLPLNGNLAGDAIQQSISFDDLSAQIDADRPLGVRIGWPPDETLGHFVVAEGYQVAPDGSQYVTIGDPSGDYAASANLTTITLGGLLNNYGLAGGKWDWSYCTCPNGGA
jgi:hypothetical protein